MYLTQRKPVVGCRSADAPSDGAEELLEAAWADHGRPVRGRELRLELAVTAAFVVAVVVLVVAAPPLAPLEPVVAPLVAAYAVATRTQFHLGAGFVVPTQLFLVPLFAFAPAALVPALVFAGLLLGAGVAALIGRERPDQLLYCGGDAIHALGPALVLVVLANGDATTASPAVLALAFAAQLVFDLVSSSLHDLLVFGVRPVVQARVLAQVWAVDAALAPLGLAASLAAARLEWAVLAPLPLVALLGAVAADRSRRIGAAQDRLVALERERERHQAAVQRIGDAFASTLDLDALLEVVTFAATEALDGEAGRARYHSCREEVDGARVGDPRRKLTALDRAEEAAEAGASRPVVAEHGGVHAMAALVGRVAAPLAVVSVARSSPFSDEERALLAHLCQQATISAEGAAHHELLRAAEAQLRQQAFHDGLTGLGNHALFADRVGRALERCASGSRHTAVAFVDLDGFKLVNDTLGHDAGDELLIASARRLTACLRPTDTAARLGGDEFALLLEDLDDPGHADAIAERVRQELAAAVDVRGREFFVHASIGLAPAAPGVDREELLRHADLAMYAAKQAGGNRVVHFQPEMLTRADRHLELAHNLALSAQRHELELRFQPIVDLGDGSVHTVEALVRWRHPQRGLLSPVAFVPLAEETGAVHELGRFVLHEACRVAAVWPETDGRVPNVSVNVSPAQLRDAQLPAVVAAAVREHGLPAHRLVLEITESVAIQADAQTQANLEALRALGARIALDDFGTGYSSLSYLARLPLDLLKLDRAFLARIETDPAQARLVGGVMQLARSLGVHVIAEGIERPSQLTHVLDLGGGLGQGYLLGAPMDAAALARHLAARERGCPAAPALPRSVARGWASRARTGSESGDRGRPRSAAETP